MTWLEKIQPDIQYYSQKISGDEIDIWQNLIKEPNNAIDLF